MTTGRSHDHTAGERESESERLMADIRLCEVTMAIRALEVVFACLCVCVLLLSVHQGGGVRKTGSSSDGSSNNPV